jgi:glucan 1,3-beta-glucosidase
VDDAQPLRRPRRHGRDVAHWRTFITEDDFAWLSGAGINAVRIPVGHWIFGPPYPYHEKYGGAAHPYVEGGIDVLDAAFDWADRHGLAVVVDLHAAPGCQNGFDNGGMLGVVDWPTRPEYIEHSLATLERLAERYSGRASLHAIEVLNEPHWDIPTETLRTYTEDAYRRIRAHCAKDDVAVVFHDAFRHFSEYEGFMREPDFSNVVLDIHRYQCFQPEDIELDIYGHVGKAALDWKNEADDIIRDSGFWTYVGEWSLGLDLKVVSLWAEGPSDNPLARMDGFQTDVAYRAYGAAQLATFEKYLGWFFWSYKTETTPAWCFRECVERGWLPERFSPEEGGR